MTRLSRLAFVVSLLALVGAVFFVGWLWVKPWFFPPVSNEGGPSPVVAEAEGEVAQNQTVGVAALLNNLADSEAWRADKSGDSVAQEALFSAQESSLNIRLIGTLVFGANQLWAVIEHQGQQKIVKPGDSLGEATVEKVSRQALFVRRDAQLEVIRMAKPHKGERGGTSSQKEGGEDSPTMLESPGSEPLPEEAAGDTQ